MDILQDVIDMRWQLETMDRFTCLVEDFSQSKCMPLSIIIIIIKSYKNVVKYNYYELSHQ